MISRKEREETLKTIREGGIARNEAEAYVLLLHCIGIRPQLPAVNSECSRCKPYVDEMFDDEVWGDYDPDYGIDQQTFWDFMAEKHYDVWCEWQHADEKERQRKRRNAARANR